MVKILHLADLHLGWQPAFLGSGAAKWQEKRDNVLTAVLDRVLQPGNEIGLALIVGDLFDIHTPPPALVAKVRGQIRRLTDHGIPVITVPGNHDEITYFDSVYRQQPDWPGILVTNPLPAHVVTIEINDEPCHIYSLAYTGGLTPTFPMIDHFPHNGERGWHIGAFHGSLNWDAGDRSLPLSGEALGRAGYDYVALGHIHKPCQYALPGGLAVYPGSIAGKGFSDPGCGQITTAALSESGVRIEKMELGSELCPAFAVLTLDAGLYHSQSELTAAAAGQCQSKEAVLLRLTGIANFAVDAAAIRESLLDQCAYVEVADLTESYSADKLDSWAQERTLRGLFIRRMQGLLAGTQDERERRLLTRGIINGLAALGSEDE